MNKYGFDRVRGGSYNTNILSKEQLNFLKKEIWGANNLCFRCGRKHFIKDCYAKIDINNNIIIDENSKSFIEKPPYRIWYYRNNSYKHKINVF
jgi:hypothetical protein